MWSADYEVFGAVRGRSSTGSIFGSTGEQVDTETCFVHLRARQYDPRTGRFLSKGTVQPNAPGSQGYQVCANAANSPTIWVGPSGHLLAGALPAELSISATLTAFFAKFSLDVWIGIGVAAAGGLIGACAAVERCGAALAAAAETLDTIFHHPDPWVRGLLESIFRAFPVAYFAVYLVVGTGVLDALAECVHSKQCVPKQDPNDCRSWEKLMLPGPYFPLKVMDAF
jgi:RHS repeat-associated protein